MYGKDSSSENILSGKQRPPIEFNMLYYELNALLDGEPPDDVVEFSQSAKVCVVRAHRACAWTHLAL